MAQRRRPALDVPQSSALAVNLEETRREVEIPEQYEQLVHAVEDYYGVRQVVEKLLTELFHPYRNLGEVARHLKSLCGGMFHYFEKGEDRATSAHLIDSLFSTLYDTELPPATLHQLLGTHLDLCVTLSRSPHSAEYVAAFEQALERLIALERANGLAFLPFSSLIKRVGQRLEPDDPLAAGFARLYRGVVGRGLDVFSHRVDLRSWCRRQASGNDDDCLATVARPLLDLLSAAGAQTDSARSPVEVFELPNIDDLLTLTLRHARQVQSPVRRISLYVFLAGVPELQYRNMEILRTLYYSIKTACDEGDEDDIRCAVDLITDHLTVCEPSHKDLLYKCLEKLGEGISQRGSHAMSRHLVERTINTGFEAPNVSGVSEEWQTWVNPHHLPCLRAWLAIIENDPIQFEQLLSALVINLHFRGVFVSDTDLFQRDISDLLNANIEGAFNLIMQLVSCFPVFFNEVGSEGQLRDTSTRIDQIAHRRDPVIHFLRKQAHAESNNRLVDFAANFYAYWRTGNRLLLHEYVPDSILETLTEEDDWFTGPHAVARELTDRFGFAEDDLDSVTLDELQGFLDQTSAGRPEDRERVLLLVTLYQLLASKYSYSATDLLRSVEYSPLISPQLRQELLASCAGGEHLSIVRSGNRVLEELKATITATEVTEAFENIFHKRHIAAGIPSMYGTYSEPKFDAMGMLLRLMTLLKPHLEACVAEFNFRYMTRESIRAAHGIMEQMLAGLRISGLRVHHLSTKLDMLERGIALGTLSVGQYLNIFDFMSEALSDVIETNYIALHNPNLERVTAQLVADGAHEQTAAETVDRHSEQFLRALIASTYAIQEFDLFLRRIRQTLRRMNKALSDRLCGVVLNYQPDRLVSFLHDPDRRHEDQLSLGYKGFSMKRLKALSMPVPDGFVVSTELFHIQDAMSYADLAADTRERISAAAERLGQVTGKRFGEVDRPLLLSVRSGAAFSMPGMMDTILNVGLNEHLLEAATQRAEVAWGAWDCYRRYLQNVAMSHGANRDLFDETMLRFKERYRIEKKLQFTAEQMREMALAYREIASSEGVELFNDPLDQLVQAIFLVLRSWNSEPARLYRQQLQLSDDWGTGVIVQEMVFGNINAESGSGVAFTRNPRSSTTGIGLFGDFTLCSQGEDVVAGLVHPYPVSEKQRQDYSPDLDMSLEQRFPDIFARLEEIAHQLINVHDYEHQEIEFTFESALARDLHLLQIRPMRFVHQEAIQVFARPAELSRHQIGSGIGVSGGALCGRVAFTEEDVAHLRQAHPDSSIVLLRPDTVPEDIHLVLAVDGLLTARGGCTSHAAVTAKRLGKCCIVNCKDLIVSESNRSARIGSRVLNPGDLISMDGYTGPVYTGEHDLTQARPPIRLS